MKRDAANLFSGFMLCLSLVLFLGAGSVHLLSNGPARVDGALTVNGDLTASNVSSSGSLSGDSLTATTNLRVLGCLAANGKGLFGDTLRTNKALVLGAEPLTKIKANTFTLDVGSITLQSSRFETVSITGLNVAANWVVSVEPLSADLPAGVGIGTCRVSADNTLKIEFTNDTIGNIDPASQTFSYVAFRQ